MPVRGLLATAAATDLGCAAVLAQPQFHRMGFGPYQIEEVTFLIEVSPADGEAQKTVRYTESFQAP